MTTVISRTGWQIIALTIGLLVLAMVLAATLIASTGGSPTAAVQAMWTGSMADSTAWTVTLLSAAPVLLVAVGTCVCTAAGTFNIGQEGQVLIGGFAGALIGMRAPYDGSMLVVAVLVCGAIGGALWASFSAVIYHYRNVNVAVSTLLMTFIAVQVVSFAVTSPSILQEEGRGTSKIAGATSDQLPVNAQLRSLGEYPALQINLGLVLAVVLTVCVAVALTRTRWGLCLRLIGLNRLTAKHAGVRVGLMAGLALAISGAFAGLAGAVLLASPVGTNRLQAGLANNVGWDGLLVALVARNRPILCLPVALLFGILRAGGDFLSSSGVPFFLVDVVKALLVLAFVAPPVLIAALHKRNKSAHVPSPAPVEAVSNEKVTA
ncbi:ABC transporter permease [Aeromicrobium sp. UC242_57]|uniref:ABC transporter permease n=1 Tax=Aeromicrobium sp. UC242_57 TaxID=3374624 RepID=UPI0037AB913E